MADFEPLMQSPSKDFVGQIFQTAYSSLKSTVPSDLLAKIAEALSVTPEVGGKLVAAIQSLIKSVLFEGAMTKEDIAQLLPEDLHAKLKSLIVNVVFANLFGLEHSFRYFFKHGRPAWRETVINSQVSLPKLKEVDWRIDFKTASDQSVRMAVPTCIIDMKIDHIPSSINQLSTTQGITFEDTLDTVLDGLGKIRDQLASVAGSQ